MLDVNVEMGGKRERGKVDVRGRRMEDGGV